MFSAGLDLVKEVYKPSDQQHLATFWQAFQGMWLRLYGSGKLTMAAINVSQVKICKRYQSKKSQLKVLKSCVLVKLASLPRVAPFIQQVLHVKDLLFLFSR